MVLFSSFLLLATPLDLNEVRLLLRLSGYLAHSMVLRVSNNVLDGVVPWSPEFGNSGAKNG